MWKIRKRKTPEPETRSRRCPGCGCPLSDPGWRSCPRCRREIESCAGCSSCGGCGK